MFASGLPHPEKAKTTKFGHKHLKKGPMLHVLRKLSQNMPKKMLFSSRSIKAKKIPNGQINSFLENCLKKAKLG